MSTGPGPTHKAEGSADASVDDIADLLVEEESPQGQVAGEQVLEGEQLLDDSLDVMLETPGPVLANTFMPPPPTPAQGTLEETENNEEPSAGTNLAYEDLLAKLVLPAKAPEAEPAMPAVPSSVPLPESLAAPVASSAIAALLAPAAPLEPLPSFKRPSSASFQIAPPSDEQTVVTDNPLVAEEQEAAVREGRQSMRDQPPVVVEEMRASPTEPLAPVNGGVKSRLLYLMLGGLLVLGGMILAVLVLKLLMPTPAPQPPVVITPAPAPQPPTPPAHVEPLPPSEPTAAAAQAPAEPAPSATVPNPAPTQVEGSAPEAPQPKVHRRAKTTHAAIAKPTPALKPAPAPKPAAAGAPKAPVITAPKAAPAPTSATKAPATATKAATAPTSAAKAPATATKAATAPTSAAKAPKAAGGRKGKGSGYSDPFDN
jgi:hypothetical protein